MNTSFITHALLIVRNRFTVFFPVIFLFLQKSNTQCIMYLIFLFNLYEAKLTSEYVFTQVCVFNLVVTAHDWPLCPISIRSNKRVPAQESVPSLILLSIGRFCLVVRVDLSGCCFGLGYPEAISFTIILLV